MSMTRTPHSAGFAEGSRRRTASAVVALAMALALAVTGCAGVRGVVPDAEVQQGVDCTEQGPAGRMPADFLPVALYRCDDDLQLGGLEAGRSGFADRYEGDLEPVIAALAAGDEPSWPGPCTAEMRIAPAIWFVDSSGAAVHVTYPLDGCGKPRVEAVSAAIDRLDFVESSIGSVR